MSKTLIFVGCYNERRAIEGVLRRAKAAALSLAAEHPGSEFQVIAVDDGSNDGSAELIAALAQELSILRLRNEVNTGIGFCLYLAFMHALQEKFDYLVIIAGNGKMAPEEIPAVLRPLLKNECDFVQGSRYLSGADYRMPGVRIFGTRAFTAAVNLLMNARLSDATCGFRAYTVEFLRRPEMDLCQPWLMKYEMEYYLLYYALKLKLRLKEVPVSMIYPSSKKYSKIRPVIGWWSMMRPWVYLVFGIRR